MTRKDLPSPDTLRQLLIYDPETGFICRRSGGSRAMTTPHIKGYFCGVIMGRKMLTHRVAWLLHYGEWPKGEIDHINGVKTDNRIENLRDVPRHINARNTKKYCTNSSGHTGVTWDKSKKKWVAQITLKNKAMIVGRYSDIEDAITARQAIEQGHGFTERHGK